MPYAMFLLIIGFVLLVKGADYLVDGASSLAAKLGVSSLIVGLTVVALGTSMPELVVNLFAAVQGTSDIALGNIVGSNIANIALVLGAAAVLFPMRVHASTVWKEIPFALLAVVLLAVLGSDALLDAAAANVIGRADGLVLLSFGIVFIYYIFGLASSGTSKMEKVPDMPTGRMAIYVVSGIVMLVLGGKLVVDAAVDLATAVGISSRIVGLTVVAIGTSLPELVTSVVAAYKKQPDMSVGNIVGSNILNVFLILGITSVIGPLSVSSGSLTDIGMSILVTILLLAFIFIGRRHTVERWMGATLIALYCVYMGWTVANGFV